MPSSALEYIKIDTGKDPQFTVIWLHGLGADGHDFEAIIPELHLPPELAIRFIFPHAPIRPITINNGMPMRGWYDIKSLELDRSQQDPEGVIESREQVLSLVNAQISLGIEAKHIILAGFSQGGAIALFTALTQSIKFAGVMVLSAYLPVSEDKLLEISKQSIDLPIFMAHGEFDDIVKMEYAVISRDILQRQGFRPSWHSYKMAHSLNQQEIRDISNWLQQHLLKT